MNSTSSPISKIIVTGVCLSLLTILFGFIMGLVFGAHESAVKARLENSGASALQTAYQGDIAAKDKVVKKSWSYLKRAHLHGGAIGSAALVSIIALILLGSQGLIARFSSLALGAGSLIYSIFWLLAGLTAPGIGSTGAAKEALVFVAMPGAGLCFLGLVGIIFSILKENFFHSAR